MGNNTSQTPQESLLCSLGSIFSQYSKDRKTDAEKWREMTEEARYGKLLMLGVSPQLADKYSKRELALIPSPTFDLLMNL